MKNRILLCFLFILAVAVEGSAQTGYKPAEENMKAREWFQDAKFGLFIHWGIYSTLGNGEWVMQNNRIAIPQYEKLADFFNPIAYNPDEWVLMAKEAGMKYICITSKHHDGFAMYHSNVSPYNVVDRTPYGKDVIGMLAEACRRHGLRLFIYYSQLDWHHPDYFPRGMTGQFTGRADTGNFSRYLDYQDAQLREILTQYGPIVGIWFDGWWDRKWQDWRLDKTYAMIHELQPACLIGNNHHVKPFPGEDFQMFEKDLPGHNTTGWASESEVSSLPLETCETMTARGSWGFDIYDPDTKKPDELIRYIVKAAGYNSNFLLNVGPMPNGRIQPEFVSVLKEVGAWMKKNGEAIYGTRGGPFPPRDRAVSTQKGNTIYLHIFDYQDPLIALPPIAPKIVSVKAFGSGKEIPFKQTADGIVLTLSGLEKTPPVTIVEMKIK
ncbi:MAG TPA: alpha-L-fucosidase [Bacteroidales bacterium]|nr:alpha-L-fucosidase [Bacteroidales bacterium]